MELKKAEMHSLRKNGHNQKKNNKRETTNIVILNFYVFSDVES